jgi:PAS domain S-box-containing protein
MLNVLEDLQEEKVRAEKQVIETEKFRRAVDEARSSIVITKADFKIIYANKAAEELTGYSAAEILGQTPRLFKSGRTPDAVYKDLFAAMKARRVFSSEELFNKKKDGREYQASLSVYPILKGEDVEFFVGVQDDISARKQAEKAKTEFVSIASHQLRTPLTAMRWYLEAIIKKPGTMQMTQIEKLSEVYRSTLRLIDLVNAMLDTSRLETGTVMQQKERVDMSKIVADVSHEQSIIAERTGVLVDQHVATDVQAIITDPKLARMIPENLLSNAIKYTARGKTVEISLQSVTNEFAGKQVAPGMGLTVKDAGIGIPAAQQPRVFEKMFRADNARNIETIGTGLGLYTIKMIVEGLGGIIWFDSVENVGTTFYVYLPYPKEQEAAVPPKDPRIVQASV